MRDSRRLLPDKHSERKTHGKYLIALAYTAFRRKDCRVVRPFLLGGMGDLESRRPSSGGGLFTFDHAAQRKDEARRIAANIAKLLELLQ